MRPLAVFDTNILFSGTGGWKGSPYQCLQLARAGIVELVTCSELLEELNRTLQEKLAFSPERAAAIVVDILSIAKVVGISGNLKVVSADPDDDKVVECAVVGSASYIVTGERRHLLPIKSYSGIGIVTAVEFLALVSRQLGP